MPDPAPIILLTRPLAQSQEFRALLPAGANVLISPVLEIQPIVFSADIGCYSALVFASANGVRAAARCLNLRGVKAITVGDSTAKVAAKAGMLVVSGNGGSDGLVALAIQENLQEKVLFLHGRHSSGDVAEKLILGGLDTDSMVIYEQAPMTLTENATSVLRAKNRIIVPLFSPRSANLLSAEALRHGARARICLVAMSENILAGWGGPAPEISSIARDFTAGAMAEELGRQLAGWS